MDGSPRTLPQGADEAEGPPPTKFYELRDNLRDGSGKKQRTTIDLKAGSYIAVCTVGNGAHAAAGMFINFTVGAQDGETFTWGS